MFRFIHNIVSEMYIGNFSFAILIVGILQLIEMKKKKEERGGNKYMIRRFLDRIEFEEQYQSEEYETTTLYFIAPVEILKGKYPEAISAEISIEFPALDSAYFYPKDASVEMSPTCEDGDGLLDYAWFDVDLPYDEIELLLSIYDKAVSV